MQKILYKESYAFRKQAPILYDNYDQNRQPPEPQLLKHVLESSRKGDPGDVIRVIDEFCRKTWMMNLGDVKGQIVRKIAIS